MRDRRAYSTLRWISIALILAAVILLTFQLIAFSRMRANYPPGMEIANVPVGGLDRQEAAERLLEVYSQPIELHYDQAAFQLDPAVIDFQLNLESMLAAADLERTSGSFWVGFWDYLWSNLSAPQAVPLDATYSEALLRSYLTNEIAVRYDQPATPAKPLAGTVQFEPGIPGTTMDIDSAVLQIERALRSPTDRTVELPLKRAQPSRPSLENLRILLQQTIDLAGFDGIAGVYLRDLQTGQELHFISRLGEAIPTQPDVAFTAASIIKIPIMVSAYRRLGSPLPQEAEKLLADMIEESGNDPADWLMEQYIDPDRGPLEVTADMRALGLENTFLAGHFRLGSPLLAVYETPANSRTDVSTEPDPYNQTTLSDIGMLLSDIYQCAQTGGGTLAAVFPGEITQAECQDMVNTLTLNEMPFLIPAGLPDGTLIAHKHGWVTNSSDVISTMGNAAIVFTPSGDYVLVIYVYHPVQVQWEPVSTLFGDISRAVYNYYNTPTQ